MDNLSLGKLPIIGAFGWIVSFLQSLQLLITLHIKTFACIIQYFSLNKLQVNYLTMEFPFMNVCNQ